MTRHASDRQAAETDRPAAPETGDPVHPGLGGAERPRPDLVAIESVVRGRWAGIADRDRAVENATQAPQWTCWAEPQSAAGLPGLQDVPAQVLADTYRRLKMMQGLTARRGSGIGCHGIDVEVPVERELGLRGRSDLEAYGLSRFNARCREFAARHSAAISDLSMRLGCFGADPPNVTMDPGFVESVWWSLGRLFEAGLVGREERITPYCPRCQTPLSAQDLCQSGARGPAEHTSVIVRFRLATLPDGANPRLRGADLLAMTARPWTLAGNVAIAVHPHQSYALARRAGHDDGVIVAEARLAPMLGADWHIAARLTGADLAGATYHPVLNVSRDTTGTHPVIAGYFVQAQTGTGLMPLAPAYGPDDLDAARLHGLAAPDPLGTDGRFAAEIPLIGGAFFADADRILVDALTDAGSLLPPAREADGEQACWRCGTPVFPRRTSAWYLRSSTGWPDDDADWMISRTRYWATPLPFWECPDGHLTCAESLAQLSELAGADLTGMDPHRPQIDDVMIACPQCAGRASRVPHVLDARYDASWLPSARERRSLAAASSDDTPHHGIIVGSADHSGGWPSAARQIGAMVNGSPAAYRVLTIEPVVDGSGRAMNRSLGNVVEPLPLIERHGSDVIRWFCVAAGQTECAVPLSDAALEDIADNVLVPYWQLATALINWLASTGADTAHGGVGDADRRLVSELEAVISEVTAGFDDLKPAVAAARISQFIDLLVRDHRSEAARMPALRHGLHVVTRLMAPIAPFVTDEVWSKLLQCGALPGEPASVHLASWPRGTAPPVDGSQY